ncbi:acyl-CoA dehydrogenase family protein [Actinoplanes couchii]|uniref:Acyl-CoA dehydrogenase n=1 Tax=Actinoplanes couchii TaxID=403638 RepID=A0ABQ3XEM8_9ACTN|nr:acyl-CoA dehydrogenase family protein [Actinoplanes couchii]MDR6319810.1 alkylation response protein AidB-like acyl-CoA dehydrogenase [Actinoplanes couchii]GID56945.1 acyl-CoA dehydrogenase [Actinoplanes couchii]
MVFDEKDRLPAETFAAMREAGDFAMAVPLTYGGAGSSSGAVLDRLIELGQKDASVSWVAGVSVVSKVLAARLGDDTVLKEIFADPRSVSCGSGRPECGTGTRDGDDVLVTGAWPNVSGCEDADWAGLGLMLDGAPHVAYIPAGDLRVEHTWRTVGMRATGSHTLTAGAVRVPAAFVLPMRPFPVDDVLLFALTVLGPVIGAARGALNATTAMFGTGRKPFMTAYTSMGESPGARHWLAEATHLITRAEQTAHTIAAAVDADGPIPPADLPRWQMAQSSAARDCRTAVDMLLDLHGGGGFSIDNPIQRFWRDVAADSRHPHLNPYLATENLGKVLTAG